MYSLFSWILRAYRVISSKRKNKNIGLISGVKTTVPSLFRGSAHIHPFWIHGSFSPLPLTRYSQRDWPVCPLHKKPRCICSASGINQASLCRRWVCRISMLDIIMRLLNEKAAFLRDWPIWHVFTYSNAFVYRSYYPLDEVHLRRSKVHLSTEKSYVSDQLKSLSGICLKSTVSNSVQREPDVIFTTATRDRSGSKDSSRFVASWQGVPR